MVEIASDVSSNRYANRSSYVLFVEGGGTDRFDVNALKTLFEGTIRIEPLGPSDGVRFAADAFAQSYPDYFFLIDRDTRPDKDVNQAWKQFDQPQGRNLLILRKREIENYFLDVDFLALSTYFTGTKRALETKLIEFAEQRLYMDALNYVLISIREELKTTGISLVTINDVKTEATAVKKIEQLNVFDRYRKRYSQCVDKERVKKQFSDRLKYLRGDSCTLSLGIGEWINQMEGKEILHSILNLPDFKVKTSNGKIEQGKEKFTRICKDLLKKENQKHKVFPRELLDIKRKIQGKIV